MVLSERKVATANIASNINDSQIVSTIEIMAEGGADVDQNVDPDAEAADGEAQ